MRRPLEYSNTNAAGRVVETPEGKRLVTDIRALGCPTELADRIEQRNAERNGTVPPNDLQAKFNALKATISATV
jgi:hypothetical protein